jgi:hypothetical protein
MVQITPCSETLSVYAPPLMSETKLHTHTEPQATLQSYIFYFLQFSTADETAKKISLLHNSLLSLGQNGNYKRKVKINNA